MEFFVPFQTKIEQRELIGKQSGLLMELATNEKRTDVVMFVSLTRDVMKMTLAVARSQSK
jgi:hypothetical protein